MNNPGAPPAHAPVLLCAGRSGAFGLEDAVCAGQMAAALLKALPEDMRDRVRGVTVDGADQVSFRLGRTTIIWGDAESPKVKVRLIPILLEKKPKIIDVSAPGSPVTTG